MQSPHSQVAYCFTEIYAKVTLICYFTTAWFWNHKGRRRDANQCLHVKNIYTVWKTKWRSVIFRTNVLIVFLEYPHQTGHWFVVVTRNLEMRWRTMHGICKIRQWLPDMHLPPDQLKNYRPKETQNFAILWGRFDNKCIMYGASQISLLPEQTQRRKYHSL